MDTIHSKCLIVNLSISQWTARKLDKTATKEVTANHAAADDAVRANKQLIPKDGLSNIVTITGKARGFFYANTLPWKDNGDRCLKSTNFHPYMEGIRRMQQEFDAAVDLFCANYSILREQARFRLNTLYNDADYPNVEAVRGKFGFYHTVEVLNRAGDFRVEGIEDEDMDELTQQITSSHEARMKAAMKDAWQRVHDAVSHLATRLRDPEARFTESTLDAVKELGEVIPTLNVLDDPDLADIAAEVGKAFRIHDAKTLREAPAMRSLAVNQADAILNKMAGLW